MSFISNKIFHSVSTIQHLATKQERHKSVFSSPYLSNKISQKIQSTTVNKQLSNWQVNNDGKSLPFMTYFTGHNNMIVAEIQTSLTQLQIIMDRIQNKAMNEQASIEVMYKQLKEVQRIISAQLKDIDSSNQQSDKQQLKSILSKIKSLFVTVKQKLIQTIDFKQPLNYFREEQYISQTRIDQTFPLLFQHETKQRQKQWQQQIDAVSQIMFDLESEIHLMQNQTIERQKIFQLQLQNMHGQMIEAIMVIYFLKKEEKQITNYQHDVILQLIRSTAQRVAYI